MDISSFYAGLSATEIFAIGRLEFEHGFPRTKNVLPEDSPLREIWFSGWDSAFDELWKLGDEQIAAGALER